MTQVFRQLGAEFRRDWDAGIGWECKRSAIAFAVLMALAFAACRLSPSLLNRVMDLLTGALSTGGPAAQTQGLTAVLALLAVNIQACSVSMLYGMIPFLYLPALALGLNSMLLGVMAAWYVALGYSSPAALALLLPQFLFEVPALILSFGAGLFVCGQVTRRIRGDEAARPAMACLMALSRALILLLPFLALSAAAETLLTPAVAALIL